MGKNIEVTLDAFGDKKLTAVFPAEDLKGKKVQDIVQMMMTRNWQGEDKQALSILSREVNASNGYIPQVNLNAENLPVKYQPISLGDPITKYVQDNGMPEDALRLTVVGDHVVGNK